MVIHIEADLESALSTLAIQQGLAPETLALNALRERFLMTKTPIEPRDEWERRLLSVATECGVSLSDEVVSSEGLYD